MEKQPQAIQDNLWWVIPGKLAGVRKPVAAEIAALQSVGVRAIVSVMDDPSNLDLYQQLGIPHLWLPIQGGTAPSREQTQEFQRFVDDHSRLGHAVVVHCTSGRRRTGAMLASYLIQTGSSYSDAIRTILNANPVVDLRDTQIEFLQALDRELGHEHKSSNY
jgi:atypical dual specificity phosphatase